MSSVIDTGTIHVFTYREGLLSPVAHDLRLTLGRFRVQVEGQAVDARFEPASLQVDGAVRDGRVDASALRESDRRDIHRNITDKILLTARHPEVRFQGRGEPVADGWHLEGDLTMVGRTQPIAFDARRRDGRLVGRVELVPSRWGIKPYKALLGAIRLQDRVTVAFDLPEPD